MNIATMNQPMRMQGFVGFKTLKDRLMEHIEIVIVILCALMYWSYTVYEQKIMQEVFDAPRKSDYFYIDYRAIDTTSDARFRYVPMKVLSVEDDGIWFKVGNIAHTTRVSPTQHAKFDKAILMRNYFRTDPLFLPHFRVQQFINSGAIYNARRPRNVYIGGWMVIPEHEIIVEE